MGVEVGEGDLVALDLAAVALGDFAGEGDGLGDVQLARAGGALLVAELDDVLLALVLDLPVAVLDGTGAFDGADGLVSLLLEVGFGVDFADISSGKGLGFAVLLVENVETCGVCHDHLDGIRVIGLDHNIRRDRHIESGGAVSRRGSVSGRTDQGEGGGQGEDDKGSQHG